MEKGATHEEHMTAIKGRKRAERKRTYRKKRGIAQRPGRVERLTSDVQRRATEVAEVSRRALALSKIATKANAENKQLRRKLQEAELQTLLLKDPNSRANRLRRLGISSRTRGTSGHFVQSGPSGVSLLACIKIIRDEDFTSGSQHIGSGRFGACYLRTLCHYQVCVKQFKCTDSSNSAFIHEANILSKFTHFNLPYLFGICLCSCPSIVTSFHGFNSQAVTVHCALYSLSKEVRDVVATLSWMDVVQQISRGLEHLHCYQNIIHNDLKCDNVVLASSSQACVKVVIIDFGKACELAEGKKYTLNHRQREQYKVHHPHVAPDVRDGLCKQSDASDVYALGRIIHIINSVSLDNELLREVSCKCMQYQSQLRPNIKDIRQMLIKE